jgi:dihydrofolate reductase
MKLGIIYARSRNGVIGKDNAMPWHLPEDLAHFKRTTLGAPVIMGRKTWESIPPKFRPLPGRQNIVITRDAQWNAEGADRASSLEDAISLCGGVAQAWVTGGAEIYRLALSRAHVAVVTEIEKEYEGDAFAPELGAQWREVTRERHVAASGLAYSFITYENQNPEN